MHSHVLFITIPFLSPSLSMYMQLKMNAAFIALSDIGLRKFRLRSRVLVSSSCSFQSIIGSTFSSSMATEAVEYSPTLVLLSHFSLPVIDLRDALFLLHGRSFRGWKKAVLL